MTCIWLLQCSRQNYYQDTIALYWRLRKQSFRSNYYYVAKYRAWRLICYKMLQTCFILRFLSTYDKRYLAFLELVKLIVEFDCYQHSFISLVKYLINDAVQDKLILLQGFWKTVFKEMWSKCSKFFCVDYLDADQLFALITWADVDYPGNVISIIADCAVSSDYNKWLLINLEWETVASRNKGGFLWELS